MPSNLGFNIGGHQFNPLGPQVNPNLPIYKPDPYEGLIPDDDLQRLLSSFAGGQLQGVQNLSGQPYNPATQNQGQPYNPATQNQGQPYREGGGQVQDNRGQTRHMAMPAWWEPGMPNPNLAGSTAQQPSLQLMNPTGEQTLIQPTQPSGIYATEDQGGVAPVAQPPQGAGEWSLEDIMGLQAALGQANFGNQDPISAMSMFDFAGMGTGGPTYDTRPGAAYSGLLSMVSSDGKTVTKMGDYIKPDGSKLSEQAIKSILRARFSGIDESGGSDGGEGDGGPGDGGDGSGGGSDSSDSSDSGDGNA